MLHLIRIRNFALIRELEIEFDEGLNLLTGETGSGKSILVDALGLLLGARSSQEMIRSDCDTAVLEGIFEIENCKSACQLLKEYGFETENGTLVIRREISFVGRNRVFINGYLATLSQLKTIGEKLVDIHGQQDQRTLLDLSTHLEWLDYFGGNDVLLKEVRESFKKLKDISRQLETYKKDEQERLRRIDMLQFQIEEIRNINPRENEREDLEREQSILSNRERIAALASEIYAILYDSESSILSGINLLDRHLEELGRYDAGWTSHRENLQESRYTLEDLAYAARDCTAHSDFSPERLEQVNQRLFALEKLTKKYGSLNGDVLEYYDNCMKELEGLLSYAVSAESLSERFKEESVRYRQKADKLSNKRKKDAGRLEKEIRKEFAALAMERMELQVQFHSRNETEMKGILPGCYGLDGIDHVEFLIAPNKGEEMRPLAKIASGGELSRLMLSIKSLCGNEEKDRTLVFDEVDAGIGGRVAEAVGKRLRSISEDNQVLCVTHLPQIAAFANNHFNVSKETVGGRTETFVRDLDESEQIQELSRMLGGATITPATRRYALEMKERSRRINKKE